MKTTLAALLGFLLIASHASAVIIPSSTASGLFNPSTGGGSFSINYDPVNPNSVVVVAMYLDGGNGAATSLTYGGNSPDGFLSQARSTLAYFLNPSTGGSLTLDGVSGNAAVTNAGYYIWELAGVDLSAPVASVIGTDGTTQITTTAANSFIVDSLGFNPFGANIMTAPDANSILSESFDLDVNSGAGGGWLSVGEAAPFAAGTYELGWTASTSGGLGDLREMAFAFVPLPGGPVAWSFDGGGNWSDGTKWSGGSPPTSGGEANFGSALTAANAPANVSLDVAVNASSILFSSGNRYNIVGPQTLTLSGDAEITTGSGTHGISAVIAGSSGLTKSGGGALVLSGANTYTGPTTVSAGSLQLANAASVNGAVSVEANSQLAFVAGYNGNFSGGISGAGSVLLDASLTTGTVTFSGAKTYGGATQVSGGTLAISNAGALGTTDGTPATGTTVSTNGSQGNAKLALSGGITVNNELLTLFPRRGEGVADLVHVTSAGNNTWAGNIKGDVNGDNYNFESTSGTLTLSGTLSAPDNDGGIRNFVFSGAGNTSVTGRIVDYPTNETGGVSGAPLNLENNVNVIKRGTGTLSIRTGTDANDDFWFGSVDGPGALIEQGTLEVVGMSDNGELRSDVQVRSGATFKVNTGFTKYNLLPTAPYEVGLSGGGTVTASTLGIWESNTISPGDGVGTLKVNGNVDLFYFDPDETTINNSGSLNFELGSNATVSGVDNAENDLISVSGTLRIGAGGGGGNAFGSEQFVVNAIIADGVFDTNNNYTLMRAGTLTTQGGVSPSNFQVNFTDALGNVITGSRYTAAVVLNTAADEVQLNVDGTPVSLTWSGANSTAWDIQTTANWTGGDTRFSNLDAVTFDDSSATAGGQPGDFNNDGSVNAADYTVWRDNLGQSDAALNGNGTGDGSGNVVQADYTLWRNNYGQTGGGGGAVAIDISGADVFPSVVNFTSANGTTFTVTGANGFGGGTPINVTGDATAVLANNNTLQGNISIAAGATLNIGQGGGASTVSGNISGAGTLVIGGGFNPFTSANSLTGPIVINAGTVTVSNAGALGSTAAPTTVNAAGTIDFNFQDLGIDENLIFNGGTLRSNDSTLTYNGDITIGAGGANFQITSTTAGTPTTTINGEISGTAAGPVLANVSAGVTLNMASNISNNGLLRKTGAGTLVIGASSTIGASEIAANGGSLDVSAKSALTLASGQTLSGLDGTVTGNVTAPNGSTVRVGAAGLPEGPAADYVDATWGAGGNTTFIGGAELNPPAGGFQGNNEWAARTFGNNGNLLQGAPTTPPDEVSVPEIQTTISGLTPNTQYQVYTNFWDDSGAFWPIQTGSSQGVLTLFQAPGDAVAGATDAIRLDAFQYSDPGFNFITTDATRTLYGAPLGTLTSNGAGEIVIFIDDTGAGPNGRTLYDGVTLTDGSTSVFGQSFTIDGELALGAGSTIQFDIAGSGVNDLLEVTGALTVSDGFVLEVLLDPSVSAASLLAGDSWDLLDFASASGLFDQADFVLPGGLSSGLAWDTSNLLSTGVLSVVNIGSLQQAAAPEPSALVLAAGVSALLAGRRRNRAS